ncbi:MAG: 4-(cytidine 5'-diphospho)-2-C-methyl-D-erythritol kinase [Candidatus Brocadiales bacterium]
MDPKKTITLTAPAKINLFLEVLGKRPDGYHELETVMQEIDLADTLRLEVTDRDQDIELTCTEPDIPCDQDNLVWKAARIFQKETGIKSGVRVHLIKRIPVAAGLGGGSSDAATVLKGLNTLCNTDLSETRLMDMAARLGSDVPFFVKGGTALCKGRGEIVTPLEVKHRFSYILLYPNIRVSTAKVYNNLKIDLTREKKDVNFIVKALLSDSADSLNISLFNRLEEVALELYPELRRFKGLLESYLSDGVLLSGSGSAIYGHCENQREANNIKEALGKRGIKKAFVVSN